MTDIKELYKIFHDSSGVTTDSRDITPGTIFFALKGENFNGNDFVLQALKSGAAYAVTDNTLLPDRKDIIKTRDVLETLQKLAQYHRMQFSVPVLAITGSNGKTTTKELIYAVLSTKYNVLCTSGNYNNHIGVPLTLLKMDKKTDIAVIEMGANAPGEISLLCGIASPTEGIITSIGKAHLQGFGDLEGVKNAKGELYKYLQENGGTALYNQSDPIIAGMTTRYPGLKLIPYTFKEEEITAEPTTSPEPFLKISINDSLKINTRFVGEYNKINIVAALSAGDYYGTDIYQGAKAIEQYIPGNNRSQLIHTSYNTLVVDAYNANPTSMNAALENFNKNNDPDKGVILGDMLELGKESLKEHTAILKKLGGMKLKNIFLVGLQFADAAKENPKILPDAFYSPDCQQLKNYFKNNKLKNHTLLIKGSRGIQLEKIIEEL